jgi:putative tryptophan/tyrosine transport system substrate-binding protein
MLLIATIFCLLIAPLTAASQVKTTPKIGFLDAGTPSSASLRIEAFRAGLRDLGYLEGQNILIEYGFAGEDLNRLSEIADALVRLKVDVIVARSTAVIRATKRATSTIPIVMAAGADAVRSGLVDSLARPGGNVTGLTTIQPELAGKRIELLRELIPRLSHVAFLVREGDTAALQVTEMQEAGRRLGVKPRIMALKPAEFEHAFSTIAEQRLGAVVVQPFFIGALGQGRRIAHLAARHRLPCISGLAQFADEGGLLSYGPDVLEPTRRAAVYVDKILKGVNPATIPVEQPTKFEFVINLKTAKRISLTIPPNVLARADRVIN